MRLDEELDDYDDEGLDELCDEDDEYELEDDKLGDGEALDDDEKDDEDRGQTTTMGWMTKEQTKTKTTSGENRFNDVNSKNTAGGRA